METGLLDVNYLCCGLSYGTLWRQTEEQLAGGGEVGMSQLVRGKYHCAIDPELCSIGSASVVSISAASVSYTVVG